jgi:hypothetical protein
MLRPCVPMMRSRSREPGERWLYCYPDDTTAEYGTIDPSLILLGAQRPAGSFDRPCKVLDSKTLHELHDILIVHAFACHVGTELHRPSPLDERFVQVAF